MRGELPDARDAARDYERTLTEGFAAAGRHDGTFDVMLLGLGEDAHIASIFPGSALLDTMHSGPEGRPLRPRAAARVAAVWAEHLGAWRITLTPLAILDSRDVLMIVSGGRKASAVHAALEGARDVRRTPAQLLRDAGDRVEWIIDRAASPYAAPPSPSARPG
jgi:6-phosphogluconolactonase